MRAVPVQIVIAITDAGFGGESGLEIMSQRDGRCDGVVMQHGDEIGKGRPDESRVAEAIENHASGQMIAATARNIVKPFNIQTSVEFHGRSDQRDTGEHAGRWNRRGRRILLHELVGVAHRLGVSKKRRRQKIEDLRIVETAAAEILARAGAVQPVADDRSAHHEARLNLFRRRARGSRREFRELGRRNEWLDLAEDQSSVQVVLEAVGVEHVVLQIEIQGAVILIGSRAGDRVRQKSRGATVLGRKIVSRDAVFLNRFGRDRDQRSSDQVVVVFNSIQQEIRGGGALPDRG